MASRNEAREDEEGGCDKEEKAPFPASEKPEEGTPLEDDGSVVGRVAKVGGIFDLCPWDDLGDHEAVGQNDRRSMAGQSVAFEQRGCQLFTAENTHLKPDNGVEELGDAAPAFFASRFEDVDDERADEEEGAKQIGGSYVAQRPEDLL